MDALDFVIEEGAAREPILQALVGALRDCGVATRLDSLSDADRVLLVAEDLRLNGSVVLSVAMGRLEFDRAALTVMERTAEGLVALVWNADDVQLRRLAPHAMMRLMALAQVRAQSGLMTQGGFLATEMQFRRVCLAPTNLDPAADAARNAAGPAAQAGL